MTEGGFFNRRTGSPASLVVVVAMHAAALGALVLLKGPEIYREITKTVIYDVPVPRDPDPEPPPEPRSQVQPRQLPPVLDRVDPVIDHRVNDTIAAEREPPLPPTRDVGPETIPETRVEPATAPIRIAAVVDPRYSGDLQPPYPASEQRAQRGGTVRVRVTIGADGRVRAIERLSATSEAFWRATERHALARWRFRPATLDGRPVESTKTMNVYFRIEDA